MVTLTTGACIWTTALVLMTFGQVRTRVRAARHEALAALVPGDGRDVRGMPDGMTAPARHPRQPRHPGGRAMSFAGPAPECSPLPDTRGRRHPRAPVKAVLLDQTLIAGIGNIYADESLHRARIHMPPEPAAQDSGTPGGKDGRRCRHRRDFSPVIPRASCWVTG